jgi:hypothetical protein
MPNTFGKALKSFRGIKYTIKRIREKVDFEKVDNLDGKVLKTFLTIREKLLIPLFNKTGGGKIDITIVGPLGNKMLKIEFFSEKGYRHWTIIHSSEIREPKKYKRKK